MLVVKKRGKMIKLKINLTGDAEKEFRELLDITGYDGKNVVLDALALIHCAAKNKTQGKQIAIFDPKTKEVVGIYLTTLS